MDASRRKVALKKPKDAVDEWLEREGFLRKHVPRDPTCLFRSVSEQIYLTQYYHIRVRRECVDFMRKNGHLFQQYISIPLESYLEEMSCFTEWGGNNEIQAMSLLYKREFVIFCGQKLVTKMVTQNGFEKNIYLCHTALKQYESVYPKDFMNAAAFCQSLVYQTLYKEVFGMTDVEKMVQMMLHERTSNFRHDRFFLKGNVEIREHLTTELMKKIKDGEVDEEEKAVSKCNTPFPYKVAKALDPNIYRNTDFDIWNEIRREVRNGGWTRWNCSELQVGGKCLVQLDFKDCDLDEANNNFTKSLVENIGTVSRIARREPKFLHGHIQEMSKNEGPVVVFVEELGEKKTLPFGALKPLAARKPKQVNYNTNCRRNMTYDSNQKWKKTWNPVIGKSKDLVSSNAYGMKNSVEMNNNSKSDSKDSVKTDHWDEETGSDQTKMKSYPLDTYNACQAYPIENTVDVRPVTIVLDNAHVAVPPNVPQHNEDYNKNSSQSSKSPGNPESQPAESPIPSYQQVSHHANQEPVYPLGMPPIFNGNPSMQLSSEGSSPYQLPIPRFQIELPSTGSMADQIVRAINFSAATNFDSNNSDLPDTATLRFFYYFGLQCFRAGHAVIYGPNGQPMILETNYIPQANIPPPNTSSEAPPGDPPSEDDNTRSVNKNLRPNYAAPRRRNSNSNPGRPNNPQQQQTKTFNNNRKSDVQETYNRQRNDSVKANDVKRPPSYTNTRKTIQPPRFKKPVESPVSGRNNGPPPIYQQERQQPPSLAPPGYQQNLATAEASGFQPAKPENQPAPPLGGTSLQPPAPGPNSPGFLPPYTPQTIYTTMPYYSAEGETFYAPGPGFYPVPYVNQPELQPDGSNGYPAPIYSPGGENYGQPITAAYPPYVYPQQAIYSGLPSPVGQENWYPMPGQPQFVQYPPCPAPQSSPNPNWSTSS